MYNKIIVRSNCFGRFPVDSFVKSGMSPLLIPLAEKGGFEPPVQLPVRQFSKLLVSATHPSLLRRNGLRYK